MTEEPTEKKIETEVKASFLSTLILLSTGGYGEPSMETKISPDAETPDAETPETTFLPDSKNV